MVLQLKLRSAEGSQRIILSRCGAAGENIEDTGMALPLDPPLEVCRTDLHLIRKPKMVSAL